MKTLVAAPFIIIIIFFFFFFFFPFPSAAVKYQ